MVQWKVGLGDHFGDVHNSLHDPLQYDGFANCYPEDKFRLVQALQHAGRVGMTGDGVNDAPALKQAEVGIAVSSASDVAKAAAKVVLTRPGLQDIVAVVSGGRRVYRRMLTWTITKIARTVELAALLTFGYLATGFFVTTLPLIVLIIVMNDIVTITLATDRSWVSPVPEQWNVREIVKIASLFAIGWLILAFVILWVVLDLLKLPVPQVQTLMFAYLIYTAQATIYMTRVRDRFWSLAPSRYVAAATLGNVLVASFLALSGILMAAVPVGVLFGMLGAILVVALLLDEVKIGLFRRAGILGRTSYAPAIFLCRETKVF